MFQGSGNSGAYGFWAANGPNMHEEQARLLCEHVTVQRGHRDVVRTQFGYHWIHFFSDKHEVARGGNVSVVCCLKIYGYCDARCWRDSHATKGDGFSARYSVREDSTFQGSLSPKTILDRLDPGRRSWLFGGSGGFFKRRFGSRQSRMQ